MMHGPLPDQNDRTEPVTGNTLVAGFARALALCNNIIVVFAAIALVAACVILSYSVLGRALFHSPNYWQDEAAVFLLVGATFMTAAYVQGQRGHIGIEAFVGLMSPIASGCGWSMSQASCSAPSLPGNPGHWRMRLTSTARCRTRCGRPRLRSPMC